MTKVEELIRQWRETAQEVETLKRELADALRKRVTKRELREWEDIQGDATTLRSYIREFGETPSMTASSRDHWKARAEAAEARCAAQVLERERALKDIGRLAEEVGRLTLLFADAEARCAVLTQATTAFLAKYDAVINSDAYKGFMAMGWIHGGSYAGENWVDELAALRAPLAKPQETKHDDDLSRVDKGVGRRPTGSTAGDM